MAATRINPRLVKLHYSYTVEGAGHLLGTHKNTVRNWLRTGLEAIDASRPTMIQGRVLRAYLEGRRAAAKRPCGPGRLYCLKCREPRAPALGMVDFVELAAGTGNLRAMCAECGTIMHRRAKAASIAAIMPGLDIQTAQGGPRISECSNPSLNCD